MFREKWCLFKPSTPSSSQPAHGNAHRAGMPQCTRPQMAHAWAQMPLKMHMELHACPYSCMLTIDSCPPYWLPVRLPGQFARNCAHACAVSVHQQQPWPVSDGRAAVAHACTCLYGLHGQGMSFRTELKLEVGLPCSAGHTASVGAASAVLYQNTACS